MKSYLTIAFTGLIMLAFTSSAQAQANNPHKLIINRITRGQRVCNRIYNNFLIQSHKQFLNNACKTWGLGRAVDLVTGDQQKIEQPLCEPRVDSCGIRSGQ
ncbi:hypothetical protein H6G33_36290 [Calothrix sp. FACHB-1219]|uniref:hypothetical protein n=1 Tax=unclassified Calothrix TaxID=2619626 RepID=UPI0016853647|nr:MULTISPECIES: hypothetical protein [unclassified Calothrix]MBD2207772.1 hypothetical protein [Calothrix sp. FACHB-168]MBD2222392.1 hypothetical protein [Calothrix sp. FACHB-1219]